MTSNMDGLRHLYGLGKTFGGMGGTSASAAPGTGSAPFGAAGGVKARPKIIYASRTHSQLAKVVKELKHSQYRPKITILGSRQQLCVHPVVSKLEGAAQTHACRSLTKDKMCQFYEHLPSQTDTHTHSAPLFRWFASAHSCCRFVCCRPAWSAANSHLHTQALDIEDLMVLGKEQCMCPYFYSRDRMTDADMVLLPYNYLIDPSIRNRLGLSFDNSLLIFDEAHNLEQICGDSASFDLTEADLALAIQEVQSCINVLRDPAGGAALLEDVAASSAGMPDLPSLAILKAILLEFEQLLDRQVLPENGDGLTRPGAFIFDILAECKINQGNKDMLLDLLDKSINLLFSDKEGGEGGGPPQRKQCALDKFASAIRIIYKGGEASCVANAGFYRVHIHTRDPPAATLHRPAAKGLFHEGAGASKKASVGRILSYWCFNPGISVRDLTNVGIRCMILTSGTLSPMNSFAAEFQLDFPIRLENPHVISADQIWVGVLEKGPAGTTLNSGFKTRESPEYVSDLGNSILNACRVVPDGLLVFFPSYATLAACERAWRSPMGPGKPSIIDGITKHKALVIEPRLSSEFAAAINDFGTKLDDPAYKGAVFFAVCRGKVSEGLDFADRAGRAVIVTGLPYPAYKDAKVRLKRLYLDELPRKPGVKMLTGQEWYNQQAARAINQAIGRVIRHRGDYGAIILADARFAGANVRSQLSAWIRPYVQTYPSFGTFTGGLARFFGHASKAYPDKAKKIAIEFEDDQAPGWKSDGLRAAGALGRQHKPWTNAEAAPASLATHATVNAAATFHASRAAVQAHANRTAGQEDWLDSFSALQGGLADGASSAVAATASAEPVRNPTLIKKTHPTSLLVSLLQPANAASNRSGSASSFGGLSSSLAAAPAAAAAASASSSSSSSSASSLLHMSSVHAFGAPRPAVLAPAAAASIKVEMEIDDAFPQSLSQAATRVKLEGGGAAAGGTGSAGASVTVKQEFPKPSMATVASSSKASSSSANAAAGGANDLVKTAIRSVKQALTPANFLAFKASLTSLSGLQASAASTTSANFMAQAAATNRAVRSMVALLLGFEYDVLDEELREERAKKSVGGLASVPSSPPFDGSLAVMFASRVPAFRMHYNNALLRVLQRWPQMHAIRAHCDKQNGAVTSDATASSSSAASDADNEDGDSESKMHELPSVKKQSSVAPMFARAASSATSSKPAIPLTAAPAPQLPLKREFPLPAAAAAAGASSSSSSSSSSAAASPILPPARSQAEFIARVKADLDESSYARFKSLVLSLESPDGAPPRLPPLQLMAQLQTLLGSVALMQQYATLMPQRLQPAMQQFLSARTAAAALKWTTPEGSASGAAGSMPPPAQPQKRAKLQL